MIASQDPDKSKDMEAFAREFMAEQQRLADAAGMNVYVYMAQAHGGMLKGTIIKLLKHAQAHPKECPADCVFLASIKRLKKEYGIG